MFSRILVPLDGSPTAEAALGMARALLDRVGGDLLLVRVVEVSPRMEADTERVTQSLREQADRYLEEVAFKLASEGVPARRLVRVGPVVDTLQDVAKNEGATLVAMSTHGRTGISRWVLGSVAERMIRSSPVPVLLVRETAADLSGAGAILLAVDGSPESLEAVPAAAALARRRGVEVLILNVDPTGLAYGPPVPEMKEAYDLLRHEGVRCEPLIGKGDPARAILEAGRDHGVGMIVMATHGRSGPVRWMLGSVAEKVLRAAPVPVLVIRCDGQGVSAPA